MNNAHYAVVLTTEDRTYFDVMSVWTDDSDKRPVREAQEQAIDLLDFDYALPRGQKVEATWKRVGRRAIWAAPVLNNRKRQIGELHIVRNDDRMFSELVA